MQSNVQKAAIRQLHIIFMQPQHLQDAEKSRKLFFQLVYPDPTYLWAHMCNTMLNVFTAIKSTK